MSCYTTLYYTILYYTTSGLSPEGENEMPKLIAKAIGIDGKEIVRLNKKRLPGLTLSSKLLAGTVLLLREGGSTEVFMF